MPSRYAHPPPHRQYRNNTRKKGCLEVEMIWESEAVPIREKESPSTPLGSPVSVYDTSYFPEMKPLILPDTWTVVGKNGKPLKGKAYDDPQKTKKKKKKSKKKALKDPVEHEPLADLAESPSSSKTLRACDLDDAKRFKAVTRAHEAKYWANYRNAKAVEKEVNATFKAMLAIADHARARAGGDDGRLGRRLEKMQEQMVDAAQERVAAQHKERRKSLKGDSNKVRTRRAARSAAAAERCFAFEENEYAHVLINPLALLAKQKAAAQQAERLAPSSRATAKTMKVKQDGAPSTSESKASEGLKRGGSKKADVAEAKGGRKQKCHMM